MLAKRVLTAFILIPLVVAIVLFTNTTVVALVTATVTILALWEFFALGEAIGHRAYRLWTIFCSLLLVALQWRVLRPFNFLAVGLSTPNHVPSFDYTPQFHRISTLYSLGSLFFLFILGITLLTLFTKRPIVESLPAAGISSSALLLVAFPLSYAVRLHGFPTQGPLFLLFALSLIWVSDTAAYFVGRAIGKHPLAPHISPNKTWEGSIAAMLGSLLVASAFHYWIKIPLPHLLAMAACGNIAGQMGDLLESACKRSAGAKDSGGLLPGHGGVLDRIDALILSIPVIWYYLVLVNPPTP
jgi:phosphatidate cytidylyltransferase